MALSNRILVEIPEDILVSLQTDTAHLQDEIPLLLAIRFYQDKRLSLGKAARLAAMNRLNFMDELSRQKIVVFDYGEDDTDMELEGLQALP